MSWNPQAPAAPRRRHRSRGHGRSEKADRWMNGHGMGTFETEEGLVGGSCYDATGLDHRRHHGEGPCRRRRAVSARSAGPKWMRCPMTCGRKRGLLRLRKDRALPPISAGGDLPGARRRLRAQARAGRGPRHHHPARLRRPSISASRKTITDLGNGQKRAIDTQVYAHLRDRADRPRRPLELARKRRNKVTSMEKRNVMKTGVLWNEVMTQLHQREFKDVTLGISSPIPAACSLSAIQAVRRRSSRNLFGDMLSDHRGDSDRLARHAGRPLRSATIDPKTKKRKALYEPVHGSAPTSPARASPTRSR